MFLKNNLRGKSVSDQSDGGKQRPRLRIKNKGGPPKGNRNALKGGYYTKPLLDERRKFRGEIRTLILCTMALVARANCATMSKRPNVTVTRIEAP